VAKSSAPAAVSFQQKEPHRLRNFLEDSTSDLVRIDSSDSMVSLKPERKAERISTPVFLPEDQRPL
jgi:hypothetical protein